MLLLLTGSNILISQTLVSDRNSYPQKIHFAKVTRSDLYESYATIDNAYVSGLQEELNFNKNQLVNLNAMYVTGAVIGQLPFTFIFPKFPMNYTIPALEVGWGIFTLLQYRTQSFAELMAYRFFVGLFEVSCTYSLHHMQCCAHIYQRPHSFQEFTMCLVPGTVAMN